VNNATEKYSKKIQYDEKSKNDDGSQFKNPATSSWRKKSEDLQMFKELENNKLKYHGKQDLCRDFGSSVPDSRCGNVFFYKKLDLINILEKICVSVY
jgi:hypothetical protein